MGCTSWAFAPPSSFYQGVNITTDYGFVKNMIVASHELSANSPSFAYTTPRVSIASAEEMKADLRYPATLAFEER
jgi:hypothetical protein